MESLIRDLRFAIRRLIKKPLFSAIAIVSLAIGIGANTAIFSLVNAIILRDLPLEDPEELVDIYRSVAGFSHASLSFPDLQDIRRETNDVFSGVAASRMAFVQADTDGGIEVVFAELVTGNFFSLVGVRALIGRAIGLDDDVSPGGHPVIMLGYGFWQRQFGGALDVVGQEVRLNGMAYTVIGVAPQEYTGSLRGLIPDVYAPVMMVGQLQPGDGDELQLRGNQSAFVKARLLPGIGLVDAQRVADRIAKSLQEQYPNNWQPNDNITLVATNDVIMNPMVDRVIVPAAVLMMGVVALVLLIACVNLASFLLAQALDRRKEVAIRLALGAERGVLIRQFVTETAVLATLGGVAGVLLATVLLKALVTADLPLPFPIALDLSLDPRVLIFSLVVTVAAGLLFGMAPALQATRSDMASTLKDESTGGGRPKNFSLRNALVVLQVAVSLLLLVGAGLFLRSLQARMSVDPGFGYDPAALVTVQAVPDRYSNEEAYVFFRDLVEETSALPGVIDVGMTADLHLSTLNNKMTGVNVDGVDPPPGQQFHLLDWAQVDPGFFAAAGIEILRGRGFTELDGPDGAPTAIVNEAFARRFWGDQSPVGRVIRANDTVLTVVGMARDAKVRSLGETPTRPYIYRPHAQVFSSTMTIVARTAANPRQTVIDLVALARQLDPEILVYGPNTMDRHLAVMLLPHRLSALLVGAFAIIALILASIGLYGVVNYAVSARSREVGIRMSLGADSLSVVKMLMGSGLKLVAIGTVIGLGLAFATGQLLGGLLYGVTGADPIAFAVVPVLLILVAAFAAWLPARRASRVNPVTALKAE